MVRSAGVRPEAAESRRVQSFIEPKKGKASRSIGGFVDLLGPGTPDPIDKPVCGAKSPMRLPGTSKVSSFVPRWCASAFISTETFVALLRYFRPLMSPALEVAEKFAAALDADDFELARSFVSEGCVYELGSNTLCGAASIIDEYVKNATRARIKFDEVIYESHVEPESDEHCACIHFTDKIRVGARQHVFRCRQRVEIRDGSIHRIVHIELEGERERLSAFFREMKVSWDSDAKVSPL